MLGMLFERVRLFAVSILIVEGVAIAANLWPRFLGRHWKEQLKDADRLRKHKWLVMLVMGLPWGFIGEPFLEELVFRAPLIVLFDSLSTSAWIGIVISAAAFAVQRYLHPHHTFSELVGTEENPVSGDPDERVKQVRREVVIKVANVLLNFILGLLSGYLGIRYQSLWVSVGLHVVWPFFLLVLFLLAMGLVYIVWDSIDRWLWHRNVNRYPYYSMWQDEKTRRLRRLFFWRKKTQN